MSRDMLDAGICKSRSFATRACLGYALLRDSEGVEESLAASADANARGWSTPFQGVRMTTPVAIGDFETCSAAAGAVCSHVRRETANPAFVARLERGVRV